MLNDDREAGRDERGRGRRDGDGAGGSWRDVSWGEFGELIRACGSFLAEVPLMPGERAAILAPNSVEWMVAALAIEAVGGVMVPIYPSSTPEQIAYVLGHSDAKVVFVGSARLALALERALAVADVDLSTLGHVVAFDDVRVETPDTPPHRRVTSWPEVIAVGRTREQADPAAFDRRMHSVPLTANAVMLYTSGTSGPPKGVPLTHMNIAVNGNDWIACNAPRLFDAPASEGDAGMVDLLWLPLSHIFGFGEACLGNRLGWTSYLVDAAAVLDFMPVVRPQVFMSVPSVWEKLALAVQRDERPGEALARLTGGRLHFCLSGGAGLKREVKELFFAHGILLIEGYGLTEASPTLTLNRPDAFRFDSVGRPLPSVELRLADDGEILARGPSVFAGYHKDPVATAAAFDADGWLLTGDVGRFTEDGFLQIVDRNKDILVTAGGKNVPPANIELRFADDPWIAHVVVYGDGERYLVAGVWPRPEAVASCSAEDLRARLAERIAHVNAQLASYETLKRYFVATTPLTLESGLLTPTLKVKRKQVYQTYRDAFAALYAGGGA